MNNRRMKGSFLILVCSLFLISNKSEAKSDKYRLIWNDDPSTTVTVGWNAFSGSNHTVYYDVVDHGTNINAYAHMHAVDEIRSSEDMQNAFARIKGLSPGTIYYFVIGDSEGVSERFWFKTAPAVNTERLSIIAGGDSRNNKVPRVNGNKLVAKLRADVVFFAGDFTAKSTASEWIEWFDDWQHTIAPDGRMTPIVPARGNHEKSNDDMHNLFDINTGNYYAVTLGGDLFSMFTLNSESGVIGSQSSWLESELNAHKNVIWKSAQYHRPIRPHNSGKKNRNEQYTYWAPLFHQHEVQLVVECDAHTVKTTWPIIPSNEPGSDDGFIRNDEEGTVFIGEGCWGAPLRDNDWNRSWTRNSGRFNQFNWIFVDKGKIEIRKIKLDNADQVSSVTDANRFTPPAGIDIWDPGDGGVVVIQGGQLPRVSITLPEEGNYFSSTQGITIMADAFHATGTITKVEFFADGASIGSVSGAPYTLDWNAPGDGIYEVWAIATDQEGNTAKSSSRTVHVNQLNQSPYPNGSPHLIPGTIEAVNFDTGGEGIAYHDSDPENQGNGTRTEGVDTEISSEGETVGWTLSGEWLEYVVEVETSGIYDLDIRVASLTGGGPFVVSFGGKDKTEPVYVSTTGAWDAFGTQTVENLKLKKGKNLMRFKIDGGNFNFGRMEFSLKSELDDTDDFDDLGDSDGSDDADDSDGSVDVSGIKYLKISGKEYGLKPKKGKLEKDDKQNSKQKKLEKDS